MSQTNLTPLNKFKVGDYVKVINTGYTFNGQDGIIVGESANFFSVRILKIDSNYGWAVGKDQVEPCKNRIVTHILNDL